MCSICGVGCGVVWRLLLGMRRNRYVGACICFLCVLFFHDLVRFLMKHYSLAQKLVKVTVVSLLQKREVDSGKLS